MGSMAMRGSALLSSVYPILITVTQVLITSVTIAFTKHSSLVRQASLPLLLLILSHLIATLRQEKIVRPQWASALVGTSVLLLFHHIDIVFLNPRSSISDNRQAVRNDNGSKTFRHTNPALKRLANGLRMTTSFRHIGTPEQVKNVPAFDTKDPTYVPPRHVFVGWLLLRLILCMLFVDLTDTFAPKPDEAARTFSTDKIPLFKEFANISVEALALRFGSTLGFFTAIYCVAHLLFYPAALPAVALGWSSPNLWRPIFNSPVEARSVRLFWG